MTFFAVLGLFPFLIFLFSLASLVIDGRQTEELIRRLGGLAPAGATAVLGNRVREFAQQPRLELLALGAVGAATSATGAVVALMTALNVVSGVTEHRSFWKVRSIAFLTMLFGTFAAVVATAVAVVAPALGDLVGPKLAAWVGWLGLPAAGLAMTVAYAVLFHVLIDVEQPLRVFTRGSVAGVALWLAATWGLSLYVAHFPTFHLTYGALGGVIVLLLWMWVTSMTLLLGAAINRVFQPALQACPDADAAGRPGWRRALRP